MARRDLLLAVADEARLAEGGVVAADVDHRRLAAGPALHRGIPSPATAGDHGRPRPSEPSPGPGVAGDQRAVHDDQHRLAVELEAVEQGLHPERAGHVQLPARIAQERPSPLPL